MSGTSPFNFTDTVLTFLGYTLFSRVLKGLRIIERLYPIPASKKERNALIIKDYYVIRSLYTIFRINLTPVGIPGIS